MPWTEWTDTLFRGLDLKDLKVDHAYFNISNAASKGFYLYTLSDECVKCPFKRHTHAPANRSTVIKLDVERNLEMRLFDKDLGNYVFPNETSAGWSAQPDLGQFGIYDLRITNSEMVRLETAKEPVNIYFCKKTFSVIQNREILSFLTFSSSLRSCDHFYLLLDM